MAAAHLDPRNLNSLWASVLVETLVRSGVAQAVISPGSRSTPLACALAAHPGIEAVPVLDERSAGFFALGLARQRGWPVVLVCTSGTAGANYYPAVIEAHESGVPLLVLTADRPPELRACASGQTIDQQKLFGGMVNFFHELAAPEAEVARWRYLRQTVAQAVGSCVQPGRGPVHLNVPFRDPLAPVDDGGRVAALAAGVDWERFFAHLAPPVPTAVVAPVPALVPEVHGVIVAGPRPAGDEDAFVAAVGELARRLGWPVLADAANALRHRASEIPHLVTTYDVVLRNEAAAERLRPEVVLCLGDWPVSKVLRTWIEAGDAEIWQVTDRADNRDGLHGRTRRIATSPAVLAAGLPATSAENGYQRLWARYDQRLRTLLDARLAAESSRFEPKVSWLLARHLPAGTPLFLASSMPVRDAEYVTPGGDRRLRVYCNRGANGIDGTLSTALGIAHGADRPAVLLTGDLAFLHDTNGLLLHGKLRGSLTVVVINNRGGGIFEHLPVAQASPAFEEFFATPQDVDLARLCAAYGVEHTGVRDWEHFIDLVANLPAAGLRVWEIATDRKRDAAGRKQWFAELAATLG